MHPNLPVTAHAMAAMLELLSRALDKVAAASITAWAAGGSGWHPLTAAHIRQGAVKMMPGALSRYVLMDMDKAAAKVEVGDENGGLQFSSVLGDPALRAALAAASGRYGLPPPVPDASAVLVSTALIEYICAEIWELSGNEVRKRALGSGGVLDCPLVAEDIRKAITADEELADIGLFTPPSPATERRLIDCDEADFKWRSHDPASDIADFGWAVATPDDEEEEEEEG